MFQSLEVVRSRKKTKDKVERCWIIWLIFFQEFVLYLYLMYLIWLFFFLVLAEKTRRNFLLKDCLNKWAVRWEECHTMRVHKQRMTNLAIKAQRRRILERWKLCNCTIILSFLWQKYQDMSFLGSANEFMIYLYMLFRCKYSEGRQAERSIRYRTLQWKS